MHIWTSHTQAQPHAALQSANQPIRPQVCPQQIHSLHPIHIPCWADSSITCSSQSPELPQARSSEATHPRLQESSVQQKSDDSLPVRALLGYGCIQLALGITGHVQQQPFENGIACVDVSQQVWQLLC